jgi:Ca2+-binding RTX toxin-like protein
MANISFANLKKSFVMWRDEIDNHATQKSPDTFYTNTASHHYVTLHGTNLEYQNGVPSGGHVDSLDINLGTEIMLGGAVAPADIEITGIDADFIDYAEMISTPTPIDRTMAMWAATLAGDDIFEFGEGTARNVTVNIAGDGYEAPADRVGGNDWFVGDNFEGSVIGDYMSIGPGRTASGGDDDMRATESAGTNFVGDINASLAGSRFIAGDDRIALDRHAYATGDAGEVQGELVAGNDTITGGDENDQLVGDVNYAGATSSIRYGDDLIHGGDGDDYIAGDYGLSVSTNFTGGEDTLYGDGGNDTIDGGPGADVIRGGTGNDSMIGSTGVDTANYSDKTKAVDIRLDGGGGALVNVDGVVEDRIDQFENIIGGTAGDRLFGSADIIDNVFAGRAGNDTLNGGGGRDTLIGGTGKDKLVGGAGRDEFRFEAKLITSNVDKIADFTRGTDKIALDDAIFKALGATFDKSEFVALKTGHAAGNSARHVIYDKAHGSLWYDADGKGGHAAVQFAQLGTTGEHPATLDWHDFAIV